jgi:hypothetical protein
VRERSGDLDAEVIGGAPEVLRKYIEAELKRRATSLKPEMGVN